MYDASYAMMPRFAKPVSGRKYGEATPLNLIHLLYGLLGPYLEILKKVILKKDPENQNLKWKRYLLFL